MNLPALYRWSQTTNNLRSLSRPLVALTFPLRRYATRRDNLDFSEQGSLLSHSLDTNRSEAKHDTVGPFQLGLSQTALRKGEKVPKWSELSTGGKGVLLQPFKVTDSHSVPCSSSYYGPNNKSRSHLVGSRPLRPPCILFDIRAFLQKFSNGVVRGRLRTHQGVTSSPFVSSSDITF